MEFYNINKFMRSAEMSRKLIFKFMFALMLVL